MENKEKKGNAFTNNPIVKAVGAQKIVVLLAVILLYVVFFVMSSSFRQYTTLVSLLDSSYYIGFMAIGVTFCLITGGVDLSIGTGMICYALMGAFCIVKLGMPVGVGMLICVVAGIIFGFFNGFLVAILNLPPFIATLCTMMITRGLGSIFTGGLSIAWPSSSTPQGWFRTIFKINTSGVLLPIGIVFLVLAVVIMSLVLNKTRPGRYIIAIGSNKEALRLSGVNVVKWQWLAYVISGFFTGLAAIAYAGVLSSSVAPGSGAGLELNAIGAAIIGGTSMNGGSGTVVGTLLGVLIMSLLNIGLPNIGLQANWQQIITGLVLILAISLDVFKNKKLARA
ncbi:MAG: ABC transporter permease [Lachnospiraceae bacterium]|nr:ABC transporter permease [Lachnospiraceae bacterium]